MQVVAISPNFANDHTVLAATAGLTLKLDVVVVFKSVDGGVTWTLVTGLPNNSVIHAVVFSPNYANDKTVYIASEGGLFVSNDGENTWQTLATSNIQSVALSPNFYYGSHGTLFVSSTSQKIFMSTNWGTTLKPIPAPAALTSAPESIAASPNFTNDHTVIMGSVSSGIFLSTNAGTKAGTSWTLTTAGMTLPKVTAIAFSPNFATDKTVFASTMGSGFLISTNGGTSWSLSNSGLTDLKLSDIALSPTYTQDSTLWVTTASQGVFSSTNRGVQWGSPVIVPRQLSDLTDIHYQTIATYPGMQFLGMFEGLWTSTNSGASWQYIDTCPTRFIRHINMSPGYPNDQTIFVSTYGSGNLWTYNNGVSWSFENVGMEAPYTDASAISPFFATPGLGYQTAWSGNHLGLQRSENGGATWQMMAGPPSGASAYPRSLAVSPNFDIDDTVYIGTTSASGYSDTGHGDAKAAAGLYVSTDGGQHWTLSSLDKKGIVSIAFSPDFANDQTAFAANQTGGVYKTTDSAATWTNLRFPTSLTGVAIVATSPNYAQDGVVFAGAISGGIYTSNTGGTSWTLLPNTGSIRALDIKFSPNFANDQTVFIGTVQSGLMESTNGGTNLAPIPSLPDVFVSAIGISPGFNTTDQTVFAAAYHGLYESTDGGNTWTYLVTPARIEESRNVASMLQEPPTITYAGDWTFVTPAELASTNQYASTSQDQSTAVFDFVGTSVDLISVMGPDQGSATITLDGIFQTSLNLNDATSPDQFQQDVWWLNGFACGNHVLTITATPGTNLSAALDAFDIWINGCPYTPGGNALRQK